MSGFLRSEGVTARHVGPCPEPNPPGPAMDFERAYRLYKRRVYAQCLYMIGNEADAEDLTQEVFLQVFRKLESFRGESAFTTWLYRVAVNVVLVRLRRKSLSTTSLEEATEVKEGIPSLQEVLGAPDQGLVTALDRLNLEWAFSQMPTGYRQVLLLHDVEGYRHREIATILGLSIGTSKSQLFKARVWLRELLAGGEPLRSGMGGRPWRTSPRAGRPRRRTPHPHFSGSCAPSGRQRPALLTGFPDWNVRSVGSSN